MRPRTLFTDLLSDLKLSQQPDHPRSKHKADHQGRYCCPGCAESNLFKQPQKREAVVDLLKYSQVIKHSASEAPPQPAHLMRPSSTCLLQHRRFWLRRTLGATQTPLSSARLQSRFLLRASLSQVSSRLCVLRESTYRRPPPASWQRSPHPAAFRHPAHPRHSLGRAP